MDVKNRQVRIQAGDFCADGADNRAGIGSRLEGKRKTACGLLGIGKIVRTTGAPERKLRSVVDWYRQTRQQ
jgi:hypothetical protein